MISMGPSASECRPTYCSLVCVCVCVCVCVRVGVCWKFKLTLADDLFYDCSEVLSI